MSKAKKPSYNMLGITAVFFMIGMMGTRPLVSLFGNELAASTIEIGLIVSMFPFLSLLFAVQIGRLVDRIGCKVPLIWSSLFGSVSLMIPVAFPNLSGLFASQILAGLSTTLFVVSAQSYAGHTDEPSKREQNVMKFSIGAAIGSFVGPLAGGYLADWIGTPRSFFLLGGIALLAVLFSFFLIENGKPIESEREKEKPKLSATLQLLKISNVRRAFLISSLILLGKDMFTSYFPLLAVEFGLSSTSIGIIVALNALAGIFIRWVMPQLIDRFGRNVVIVGSVVSSGVLFLMLPFFHHDFVLGLLSFLLGMGLGIGQPLSISTTLSSLPQERIAEGLGLRLTANRLTQTTAPFVFGMIAHLFGLSSVFFITGAIIVAGSAKTRIRMEGIERNAIG